MTDGFVPLGSLRRLTDEPHEARAASQLVSAGLWEPVEGGWQIVHYLDTQMSAARVRELREASRERYDNWKKAHKRVSNGAANGPARPPAPPARKGGGQRVEEEASGEALAGTPSPLSEKSSEPLDERRRLARAIRDAVSPQLRSKFRATFDREYGHLYRRPAA